MSGDKPSPLQQGETAREAAQLADDWRARIASKKPSHLATQTSTIALAASSLKPTAKTPLSMDPNNPRHELILRGIKLTTPGDKAR